jgi:hypothetical protein
MSSFQFSHNFFLISQKQKQQIAAQLLTLLAMSAVHPGYFEDHRSGLHLQNWLAELVSIF